MALVSRHITPDRSYALDVFRGLTIAAMILVNTPGGPVSYSALEHAAWNGWTPTDLIFPAFAFIVGVALTWSLACRPAPPEWRGLSLFDWITPILLAIKSAIMLAAPVPPTTGYDVFLAATLVLLVVLPQLERRALSHDAVLALRVVHRGFLIFALGFTWSFDAANPSSFRVFGVLERLGLAYIFAGLIALRTGRRGKAAAAAALLALYWIVMKTVPVPGWGAGNLTIEGNLAGYVDRLVLGASHLYVQHPPFDPEGLLGTIPTVATMLLGAVAGQWLRDEKAVAHRIGGLAIAGAALLGAGLWLDRWFPITKNLWSPPYVLLNGGIDGIALAICVWIVDVGHARRSVVPFIAFGTNAIALYLLSGTVRHYAGEITVGVANGAAISAWDAAYQHAFATWLSPRNASLAMALAYVACWAGIAAILYRRHVFLRI